MQSHSPVVFIQSASSQTYLLIVLTHNAKAELLLDFWESSDADIDGAEK